MENGVIGGAFTRTASPAFLARRNAVFDELLARQEAAIKEKEHSAITITLPDGKGKPGVSWETTPLDVASAISAGLAKDVLAAKVDGVLWDATRPLEHDCQLVLLKYADEAAAEVFWHSSAHILGQCLENLYGVQLCTGPAVKDGFYYDSYTGTDSFSDKDYPAIEEAFAGFVAKNQPFERLCVPREDALRLFEDNPFKVQILTTKVAEGEMTTVYRCGNLIDLCRGPHLPATGKVKAFAVQKHSACNWLGNTQNDSLQRIYGVSFPDPKQLKQFLKTQEEARKYDHRNVGKEQRLFFFDKLSPGSAFFEPHGAQIYRTLETFIRVQLRARGYTEVITPNMYNMELWEISGHAGHYRPNMFIFEVDEKEFGLKPMNCPAHCLMFAEHTRSYRDLPIRLADFGVLHRNELSGALSGLTRVRRFQQDDAHIFCRRDQIKQEVLGALDFMKYVYDTFHMKVKMELSTRPADFMGDVSMWTNAEQQLTEALNEFAGPGNWVENPGDGAFYGPKIDIKVMDALNREHQTATVQLDFQMPIKFGLQYKSSGGEGQDVFETPVIVHRAMLGSLERCIAILCEHFKGKWPFWLSPRQALVVPVGEAFLEYAQRVRQEIFAAGYNVDVDSSNSTLNSKIRAGQIAQYNYILVVGAIEQEAGTVNIRTRENKIEGTKSIAEVIAMFKALKKAHE